MFEKAHMFKYCFFAFDTDGNGFIDKNEIQNLEKCLFHDGHKYTNTLKAWRKALNNADANKDGLLDFEEFNAMLTNNPMMTYPAWQMLGIALKCPSVLVVFVRMSWLCRG